MNKTKKTLALGTVLVLAVTLTLGGYILVSAQTTVDTETSETPYPLMHRPHGMESLSQLTDEQRAEVETTIQEMCELNATREEIRAYVDEYLEANGIDYYPPEKLMPEVSEEQMALLQQLQEEVREFAEKRAQELGLELPVDDFHFGPRGHGPMMPPPGVDAPE